MMTKKRHSNAEILFSIYCAWYFLPIMRGLFSSNIWNIFFFSLYAIGIAILFIEKISSKHVKIETDMIIPVIIYMLVFVIFCIFDLKDSNSHVRVSFTYWSVLLFYYFSAGDKELRSKITRFLLALYIITYVTTYIGVITDNSVSRALSYAATDDSISKSYMIKNIASVYFIQTTVLFVPFAIHIIFNNVKKYIKFITVMLLIIEFVFLLSASFTISIILFFIALILSLINMFNDKRKKILVSILMSFMILILLCFIDLSSFFLHLSTLIDNKYIIDRLVDLSNMVSGYSDTGDAGLRLDLYISSINTFWANPFGVGPNYSYIKFDEGIGHHSQLLDDLARYGVFGGLFYIMYLKSYGKLLKKKYELIGMQNAIPVIMLVYILMLVLNLAFRSQYESIVVLMILPCIPDVIIEKRKNNRITGENI